MPSLLAIPEMKSVAASAAGRRGRLLVDGLCDVRLDGRFLEDLPREVADEDRLPVTMVLLGV